MAKAAISAVLFLLGFAAVAAAVGGAAPLPESVELRAKLELFREMRDELDVVFIGSSYTFHGVDPVTFDRETARRGQPLRSFNLALDGMGLHEADHLVRHVLEAEPARLRVVVVELAQWNPVVLQRGLESRVVWWHDAAETRSALRSTWLMDAPLFDRFALAARHGLLGLAHAAAVGRGRDALRQASGASGAPLFKVEFAARRGFRGYRQRTSGPMNELRARFLADLARYRAEVAAIPAGNAEPGALGRYNVQAARDQVEAIERAGARPVYVITPVPWATPDLYRLREEGIVPTLLAFNDPLRHPALYRVENRWDRGHLNERGAALFSTLLAHRIAELARN